MVQDKDWTGRSLRQQSGPDPDSSKVAVDGHNVSGIQQAPADRALTLYGMWYSPSLSAAHASSFPRGPSWCLQILWTPFDLSHIWQSCSLDQLEGHCWAVLERWSAHAEAM